MIHRVIKEIEAGISERFPVNLFLVNQSGLLVWANDNMLKLTGVSDFNEIKGTPVRQFGEEAWESTLYVINTRKRVTLYEQNDEKTYYVVKIPFTKRGFRGVLGFSMDVTELSQAEQAKAEFLMNMNHDIRTPFCGIVGMVELLYSTETDSERKDWLKTVLMSSERLLDFMNDINQISQVGYLPLDYETFDVIAMADDIILFLEAALKSKGLGLIRHYDGKMVFSNPFRIKHVLLNLLGNAVKFTEKGGICLSIKTAPNLLITVHDSGTGIDKAYQEKIFEEFFKIKPSYENNDYVGVGKGLYLVKKYVEELQGKVTVQSAANEGATFTVEIPLKSEQTAA